MAVAVDFVSGVLGRTGKEGWVMAIPGRQLWGPDYQRDAFG